MMFRAGKKSSVVNGTCCSSRGPKFGSSTYVGWLTTVCSSISRHLISSNHFCWHVHTHVHRPMEYPFTLCTTYVCDWFNKAADWPIAEQDKFRLGAKLRMLAGRRAESPPDSVKSNMGMPY